MWNLRGRFDPQTALSLSSALNAAVSTVFAEAVPAHCPSDPVEKQKFLHAHALVRLVAGDAPAGRGRTSIVVAIDADAPTHSGRAA